MLQDLIKVVNIEKSKKSKSKSEYKTNALCAIMWMIFRDMYTFMPGMYNYIMSTVIDSCPAFNSMNSISQGSSEVSCYAQLQADVGGNPKDPINMSLPAKGYSFFLKYGNEMDNSTLILVKDKASEVNLKTNLASGLTHNIVLNRVFIELLFKYN